jgi:hypothetical protein
VAPGRWELRDGETGRNDRLCPPSSPRSLSCRNLALNKKSHADPQDRLRIFMSIVCRSERIEKVTARSGWLVWYNRPISARFEVCETLHVPRLIRLNLPQPDTQRKGENASFHLRLCNAHDGFQVSEAASRLTRAATRHSSLSNRRSTQQTRSRITLFEGKKIQLKNNTYRFPTRATSSDLTFMRLTNIGRLSRQTVSCRLINTAARTFGVRYLEGR